MWTPKPSKFALMRRGLTVVAVAAGGLYLVRMYCAGKQCYCPERLDGKTVIITGATGGIGKETARALSLKGARVILACANMTKARQVVEELRINTNNDEIKAIHLNLASFTSIKRFVHEFLDSEKRLDVLINNAGALYLPRSLTEDGHEITFQTNYLGHFLLTLLLLDCLKASAPSRIINVSSVAYKQCPGIKFDDLLEEKQFDHREVYNHSKLAQILFTRTLAERMRIQGTRVTVNAAHPGMVDTGIFRIYPGLSHPLLKHLNWLPMKLFFKTPSEGAQTSIHLAVSTQCGAQSGYYFRDLRIEPLLPQALDDDAATKLWNESLKLTGLNYD